MRSSAVRAALMVNVATSGLRTYDKIPPVVLVPCAISEPLEFDFDYAMHGSDSAWADVVVLVQRVSERAGQDALDEYLDSTSSKNLKEAIESDQTLGGLVSALNVKSATPGQYELAGTVYMAYRFRLQIYG